LSYFITMLMKLDFSRVVKMVLTYARIAYTRLRYEQRGQHTGPHIPGVWSHRAAAMDRHDILHGQRGHDPAGEEADGDFRNTGSVRCICLVGYSRLGAGGCRPQHIISHCRTSYYGRWVSNIISSVSCQWNKILITSIVRPVADYFFFSFFQYPDLERHLFQAALQAVVGAVYAIGLISGPVVGGAFAENEHATWRWVWLATQTNNDISRLSVQ
jgi:hypothetical protein